MKRINGRTLFNDMYDDYNLEPPPEREPLTCEVCNISEDEAEVHNFRGSYLCSDCAFEIYRI